MKKKLLVRNLVHLTDYMESSQLNLSSNTGHNRDSISPHRTHQNLSFYPPTSANEWKCPHKFIVLSWETLTHSQLEWRTKTSRSSNMKVQNYVIGFIYPVQIGEKVQSESCDNGSTIRILARSQQEVYADEEIRPLQQLLQKEKHADPQSKERTRVPAHNWPVRTLDSSSLCWRSFLRYSATAVRRRTASSPSLIVESSVVEICASGRRRSQLHSVCLYPSLC